MSIDPESLAIRYYPDPVLRKKASEIEGATDEVREVAARMIDLMSQARGIGLAAPQVGLSWRLFVAHVPPSVAEERDADEPPEGTQDTTEHPMVFINPRLSDFSRDLVPWDEGCLSIPDITGHVRRPSLVSITATGLDGEEFTIAASGLLARCLQHEYDHLEGVLIIDKFTQLSKVKNRSAIRELERGARTL
jgi:peptide deformylase